MQRFKLKHHGKLRRLAEFVLDDVTGNFLCQRKWETHNYLVVATSVGIAGNAPGAFVQAGSALIKEPIPGRKKSRGETLLLALMPLQPAANNAITASIASRSKFRFNLTRGL